MDVLMADMNDFQRLLSQNVKRARQKLGYSQMKLAELCGMSANYIGTIEMGARFPSAASLQKICNVLSLKPYQLFLDENMEKDFEKYDILADLIKKLKKNVAAEIENTIKSEIK